MQKEDIEEEDKFFNLGPAWLNNLQWDIKEKSAQSEDVELMMEYLSHLWKSPDGISPKLARAFFGLFDQVFSEYLSRKEANQQSGALDAAFGLTRKQGDRNLERRNEEIATEIAKHHVLLGDSLTNAKMKVGNSRKLGKTQIEEAWKTHGMMGVIRVQIQLKFDGKKFTTGQMNRALKIQDRFNKTFPLEIKKPGK